jgi:hypothetical protein
MFEALRARDYTGALADMLYAFRVAEGIESWDEFLTAEGFTTGAIRDRKAADFPDLVENPPP